MTEIKLNGKKYKTSARNINGLKQEIYKNKKSCLKDIVVLVNGKQTYENINLYSNINVSFVNRKKVPTLKEYKEMMSARCGKEIFEKISSAKVAIAGLGGLGSNIAVMLARAGVGELLLVDFDTVEPSNLNRQHYFVTDLGELKTKALSRTIKKVNPFVKIKTKNILIKTAKDITKTFSGYEIICEAFDKPKLKALITNTVLTEMRQTTLIAASGMAGYDSANKIKTVKRTEQFYICGDMTTESDDKNTLFSPRVTLCGAHQATMVIRIILNINKE